MESLQPSSGSCSTLPVLYRGGQSPFEQETVQLSKQAHIQLKWEANYWKAQHRLPVVRFAMERRLQGKTPDYWDHATLLELAVLESDRDAADHHLDNALAAVREPWEPKTTARNLDLIRQARAARGEEIDWIDEFIKVLNDRAGRLAG